MLFAAISSEVPPKEMDLVNKHYELFRVCLITNCGIYTYIACVLKSWQRSHCIFGNYRSTMWVLNFWREVCCIIYFLRQMLTLFICSINYPCSSFFIEECRDTNSCGSELSYLSDVAVIMVYLSKVRWHSKVRIRVGVHSIFLFITMFLVFQNFSTLDRRNEVASPKISFAGFYNYQIYDG